MVRFLSPEWLARLDAPAGGDGGGALVLRQVVTGVPGGGEARYDVVVVAGGGARLRRAAGDADVTCTSDYETAVAVAAGTLPVAGALSAGRIKVSGDVNGLADAVAGLEGDPMPPALRADTEFPDATAGTQR